MGTVNLLEAVRGLRLGARGRRRHQRQVLPQPEDGRAVRRGRRPGRPRPVQRQQGLRRARHGRLRARASSPGGPAAVASARAGNVIGGGDWAADRLVPDCVRALAAGEPVVVRNPEAVRPWQHVLEPLAGYLTLGAALLAGGRAFAGAWNFGPATAGDTLPVRWVVDRFIEEWGGGEWLTPREVRRDRERRISCVSTAARRRSGSRGRPSGTRRPPSGALRTGTGAT